MVKKKKSKIRSKRVKAKVRRPAKKTGTKKAAVKKAAKKKSAKKSPVAAELGMEKIGEVTHYFPHVKAAAVMILKDSLKPGDWIYLKGHTTDFKEKVNSIQLDRASIPEGVKGQEIGLAVKSRVRIGDSVYKV